MVFVFKLIDEHKCYGCARKIKKCVEKLQGVESAEVKRTKDENGFDGFNIIAKGSFNPENIIFGVEIMKKKRIQLVYDFSNENLNLQQLKPMETGVESLKNLKMLASNNLEKAQTLTELANECEALKGELHNAWARRNELVKKKQDILNHDLPDPTLWSWLPRVGVSKKKEDESELLYGKLESKKIKVEDFVDKYKRLQLKKHSSINPLA